ncbi:MAG: universal stress protein [Geminicoccaceae bacterium]
MTTSTMARSQGQGETSARSPKEPAAQLHSIATYVDGDPTSKHRLDVAADLARQHDAHLTVVAFGYDPNIPPYAFGNGAGAAMAELVDQARNASAEHAKVANEYIAKAGLLGEAIPRVCTYASVASSFAEMVRYADAVVVGRPYGERVPSVAVDILEGALFGGDAAVIVCPEGVSGIAPETVLIGWDGSREALRAVRRSMVFLLAATSVEIAVFDPSPQESGPGESLATMLSRYGVNASVATYPRPGDSIAGALGRRATELGAGLLVIGAYSHSRFREAVIGGVTVETLKNTQVPVLMAH